MFFQKMHMKDSGRKGFTLIELIMVIVILGILAATAIPKFFALTGDAAKATANGIGSSLRASLSGLYAQYIVNNSFATPYNLTTIVLNAQVSGIKSTQIANSQGVVTVTIAGNTFWWTFNTPQLPTEPGNLYEGYAW